MEENECNQRDMKYIMGMSAKRATMDSYWKATGKDKGVFQLIG
jgi:hypothetical protein